GRRFPRTIADAVIGPRARADLPQARRAGEVLDPSRRRMAPRRRTSRPVIALLARTQGYAWSHTGEVPPIDEARPSGLRRDEGLQDDARAVRANPPRPRHRLIGQCGRLPHLPSRRPATAATTRFSCSWA